MYMHAACAPDVLVMCIISSAQRTGHLDLPSTTPDHTQYSNWPLKAGLEMRNSISDGTTIRVSSLVSGLGKCVPTAVNKYLTDWRLHCSQGTCIYFNIQVGCSVEALWPLWAAIIISTAIIMSLVICSFSVYTTNYCIILLELFSLLSLAVAPRGEAQSSGELDQQLW